MIAKIEIPLHPDSEEYLKTIFDEYKETEDFIDQLYGRTIIHMYPVEDTLQDDGTYGFIDAMNCNVHIYNTHNRTVYKMTTHDQIDLEVAARVRVFKDLSTMVIIDRPIRIHSGQSMFIEEIK